MRTTRPRPNVDDVHVRSTRAGCFLCRLDRAAARAENRDGAAGRRRRSSP